MRGGWYNYDNGGLDSRSSDGSYWLWRTGGSTAGYRLYFDKVAFLTQYTYPRGYGYSLRCLTR